MLTKDNDFRVLKLFLDSPEKKFHIREIARLTGLSPPGILKITGSLSKEGFIESKREGMLRYVYSKRTEKFVHFKRSANLNAVYDSGLVPYLREKYEEPETIVLFGSYSRGEDTSNSDIDIAVVTSKKIRSDITKFEKILNRKINLIEVKLKDAEKEFINTLSNGIVLYGYLEARI
ncbi:MAG TPA: nucleotidyltransferase domain-containing protein [archaeon]|nr:nucleotidyltransferase domain-containing protein [archaeon]